MGIVLKDIEFRGGKRKTKLLTVLFDTGAGASFVREDIAQELAFVEPIPEPLKFETAKRGEFVVAEKACRLEFKIDGEWLWDDFLVLPPDVMREEVIIGALTMQKWRLVVDMENEKVYSRSVKMRII